tara:strand:+ start:1832 stop:2785 length:954 start_codon:yes stop_codon:yes gene_type:complete
MKKLKKPNLFVVGAAKCGTTALYKFLSLHPEVYMSPIKEPHFFSKDIRYSNFSSKYRRRNYFNSKRYFSKEKLDYMQIAFIEDEKDYLSLFKGSTNEKYLGEISNGYLISKNAHQEIYNFNRDAKIIMILRNPLERAFSHWRQENRSGFSKSNSFYNDIIDDFSLNDEQWGGKSNTYVQLGLYSKQINKYLNLFPKSNIKVLFYDDLVSKPQELRKDLFKFLNIKEIDIDFSKRHNPDFEGRNFLIKSLFKKYRSVDHKMKYWIPNFIKSISKKLLFKQKSDKIAISDYEKTKLKKIFLNDIISVEEILNVNLERWK